MSKAKPKQIAPLSTDYDDKIWWEYQEYTEQQMQQLEDYLKKNAKDIAAVITPDFWQTLASVFKFIGIKPHPALISYEPVSQIMDGDAVLGGNNTLAPPTAPVATGGTNTQLGGENAADNKSYYIIISNQRVDAYTLRILQLILPSFQNFVSIKLANNNLSPTVSQLLLNVLTLPNSPVQKLFFDWNPIQSPAIQTSFFPALGSTNLEFLVLRSCQLDDEIVVHLIKNLSENANTRIRYIELYNNQVRGAGIEAIGEFMRKYNKIEYVGLAKNDIESFEPVKAILNVIGRRILTEEELAIYREKEKEKEAIISKAIKNKKKVTEDMYPHLDPLITLPDGSFAVMVNPQVKMINLSMNSLTFDHDAEYLEKYIANAPEDLQLVLFHNSLDAKYKDKLKKKYKKNIQI